MVYGWYSKPTATTPSRSLPILLELPTEAITEILDIEFDSDFCELVLRLRRLPVCEHGCFGRRSIRARSRKVSAFHRPRQQPSCW